MLRLESIKERKFKRVVKVMMIYQGGRPPLYIIWFPNYSHDCTITNLLDPTFISNHKSRKSSNSLRRIKTMSKCSSSQPNQCPSLVQHFTSAHNSQQGGKGSSRMLFFAPRPIRKVKLVDRSLTYYLSTTFYYVIEKRTLWS